MPVNIVIPGFGESITEGTVAQWLKKDGDFVERDEILAEIETEKATQGLPSPAVGVLHITAKEGDRIEVGAIIGSIDVAAKAPKARPAPSAKPEKPAKSAARKKHAPAKPEKETKLAPAARRAATEHGVDADKISGSGRHGVVLKEDVEQHVKNKNDAPPESESSAPATKREKRVPMSAIRQRIAERLLISQKSTASLTTFNEVDLSAVIELRNRYKESFQEKHGVGLGFMGFFVKASIEALKAFPLANASIDGRDIVYHNSYDVGVAVSTDKGLMVPVVRGADKLPFADIEKTIADLATKARAGKIEIADLQGGTFTITNGGTFGSMLSTPILNYPQSAILGMHAIQQRPVVRDEQIVIRPMMYLALTYDHRLIDGRDAVLFLVRIKECIEAPTRLLLEV